MSTTTEQFLNKLMNATPENMRELFLKYCHSLITEKELEGLSVEVAAYKICGLVHKDFPDDIKEIIRYACELEIPREMSIGAGIKIGDTWDTDAAHAYKEKRWEKLVKMMREINID